jgi:enoyl-[acyl-carrier protein] reductase II
MLYTPICDYFGIKYPIVLAGMADVSLHRLVAAVSNAGGLGILGTAWFTPEQVREEIRKTRELTDKPFAVDLIGATSEAMRPYMSVLLEEKVEIFVAALGVPSEFIQSMHEHGMKVVVMCGKVNHAIKAQEAGADAVVAQGTEAGGHTGEVGLIALLPQVINAVKVPVLAAGGIAHGNQIAAALTLGAQAAVIGTRFIATPEAQATPEYREAILKAREDSTMRTRCYTGKPARVIRTAYATEWERNPSEIESFQAQVKISRQNGVMDYGGLDGGTDPNRTFMPAGQGAGLIREIKPATEVFSDLLNETETALRRAQGLFQKRSSGQSSSTALR